MTQTFTDKNFQDEVLNSNSLVIVDFWAPWCAPCRIQGPILEELSNQYDETEVKIGKLNVDENPQTASQYRVMSIPTLKFIKDGEVAGEMIGLQNRETIVNKINELK